MWFFCFRNQGKLKGALKCWMRSNYLHITSKSYANASHTQNCGIKNSCLLVGTEKRLLIRRNKASESGTLTSHWEVTVKVLEPSSLAFYYSLLLISHETKLFHLSRAKFFHLYNEQVTSISVFLKMHHRIWRDVTSNYYCNNYTKQNNKLLYGKQGRKGSWAICLKNTFFHISSLHEEIPNVYWRLWDILQW